MQSPISVSVVIPSFNQGQYIGSTLRSVLEQPDVPNETLVMDGGSTDATLDICRDFQSRFPDRFRFVSEPDRGQSHAINKAVSQTTGTVIGWLNSDDTYAPNAVATARDFFANNPDVDLLYGNADFVDGDDRRIARCEHVEPFDGHRLVHDTDFIVQPAAFFTRRAFDAVGGIDESLHYAMDYDLFLKIAARFKVAYTPTLLANYKWFGENKTAVGAWDRLNEVRKVSERAGGRGLPTYARLEAALLGTQGAVSALKAGRPRDSLRLLWRGMSPFAKSPTAWRALFSPAVRKIIWTGQVLRRTGGATAVTP